MESQFKSNPNFRNVYVKGEVSDTYISAYGHLYFNLKDKKSQVPCIVYKWFRRNLQFDIEEGMKLLVIANVVVYAPHGKYQLDVRSATEDGLGQLYVKYQQLKKKLEKEGLFDDKHKKDLPHFVKRIGVITSKGGSVIHDIVKTVEENWPFCQVFLFPAAVQGENSKTELVTQISRADNSDMDVLIVARGGGSIQDLWSYNEESVARAIFNAETPVISAIGHEDNTTLADLVSDKRASTPTMAASLAIEDKKSILENINHYNSRLITFVSSKIEDYKKQMQFMLSKPLFADETYVYKSKKRDFDDLCSRFDSSSGELVKTNSVMLDKITAEYVIRHPCKMQLDQSKSNLNELINRLIDAMDFIINTQKVNLDKASDKFKFHSEKLLTSKRNSLEISKSYFKSNPCQDKIDLSKKELVSNKNMIIKEVNLSVENNKRELNYVLEKNIFKNPNLIYSNKSRDFGYLTDKFISKSNELILTKTHDLDSIRSKSVIKNHLNGYIDSSNGDLANLKLKLNKSYQSKINESKRNFESILNKKLFKNPEMLLKSETEQLDKIKSSNCFKNPYALLDDYKAELKIYEEKLDKINQVIMLKKDQKKQRATYRIIIVAIAVLVMILLIIVFGGIL